MAAFWRLRPSLRQPWRPRWRCRWKDRPFGELHPDPVALVSTTILSSLRRTTPTTPPMVVILSPHLHGAASAPLPFSSYFGRIMKYMIARTASIITIMLPIPPPAAVVSKTNPFQFLVFYSCHYTISGGLQRYFQILGPDGQKIPSGIGQTSHHPEHPGFFCIWL